MHKCIQKGLTQLNKKKKKIGTYVISLLFLLIGAGCGVLIARFLLSLKNGALSIGEYIFYFCFLIAAMYAAMFLQIILHEAGHLVCGLITGYRFCSFRIGSLMWSKENDTLKFSRLSIAGTGGQCLMCPPDFDDTEHFPYLLYNFGGALSNLITVPVCLTAWNLCGRVSFPALFFAMMGICGLGFALTNGIPLHVGSVDNDGFNAMSISRTPAARRSFGIQLKVNEQNAKGIRLKDMPDEWFRLPTEEEMQNSMCAVIAVFCVNREMDAHNFAGAIKQMDWLFSIKQAGVMELHKKMLICDRIFCELISSTNQTNDPLMEKPVTGEPLIAELLTKEQKKFMKQMKKFPSILRTRYALALLYEHDMEKAAKIQKQFTACAASYPYQSDLESERELMQLAEHHLQTCHSSEHPSIMIS